MPNREWWCTHCQARFTTSARPEQCPQCDSEYWVPVRESSDGDSEMVSNGVSTEFEGSKEVVEYEYSTHERAPPQPNVQQLRVATEDGWDYIFREPEPNKGYELYEKYNPNGSKSDDDIVPVTVAEYIDEMVIASLNYAKLIVHPSDDVYDPPRE